MARRSARRNVVRPIVFVTSSPAPYHPRHYYLMACALAEAGLPVVAMAQPHLGEHPAGPVPVVELPRHGGRFSRMVSGPRILWRLARMRPGLIQVNCLDLLPWAVLARFLLRVPVTYDSNEDYSAYMLIKEWVPPWARPVLARTVAWVEPALASRLDAVSTADEGTAARFRSCASELSVVYNFPRRELAAASGDQPKAPAIDVMYHGTLHSYYRDHIIEAARRLSERGLSVRWCLAVRDADLAEQEDLERRLRAAGVRDHFTLHFNLPFTLMPQLVAGARVGFIPLPDEQKYHVNLPRKLFEFLAAGVPAVVSDLPPIRALVGASRSCVLVTPGDDDGYANALEGLLREPERAAELGERGRQLIFDRLNAQSAVAPYVELMRRLHASRSR